MTQGPFLDSSDEYFAPNAFCCHKWSLRQGKISNIEDEQYFFCHKSLIIVCIRLDETYISSIVVNDNDIPCRLEWNIIELLRYLQFK